MLTCQWISGQLESSIGMRAVSVKFLVADAGGPHQQAALIQVACSRPRSPAVLYYIDISVFEQNMSYFSATSHNNALINSPVQFYNN